MPQPSERRLPRSLTYLLALIAGALGVAVFVAHSMLPPGHGYGSVGAVISATVARPGPLIALIFLALFLGGKPAAVAARLLKQFSGSDLEAPEPIVLPLLWGASVPLLALVGDAFSFWCSAPPLAALGLGMGVLVSARRFAAVPHRPAPESDPWRAALAITAVVLPLLLVGTWSAAAGDEPHYLVVAHSIVEDGDLDVADDYADRVYAPYHPAALSPHYKTGLAPGSRYSMHGVGLPVLLLPAYVIGSAFGGAATLLLARAFLAGLYGVFAWLLYGMIAAMVSGPGARSAARWGTAATVLLAPMLFAPLYVFSEVPAMTLAVFAFCSLRQPAPPRRVIAAAVAIALLPWIGVKYIPLAASLALAGIVSCAATERLQRASRLLFGLAVGLALHAVYTWMLYGSLSPAAVYLGSDPGAGEPALGADWSAYLAAWPGAVATAIGYLVDQKEGLLAYGPHFLLAAAGLAMLWRQRRRDLLTLAAIAAAFVGPYALSQQLGGQGPPVRPLMAILWTLSPALGLALSVRPPARWYAAGRGALLALAAALTVAFAAQPHLLPHDYPVKMSRLIRNYTPYESAAWRWFPQWVNFEAPNWPVTLAWTLLLAVVAALLWRSGAAAAAGDPPTGTARDATGWVAAGVVLSLACGFVLVHHVAVTRSDLHRPTLLDSGPTVWIAEELPQRAWAEPGGVWATPGHPFDFVITTPAALDTVDVDLSVLVDAEVAAWVQGVELAGRATPMGGPVGRLEVGAGARAGGGYAYHGRLQSDRGAAPADLQGGADERVLGVFWRAIVSR